MFTGCLRAFVGCWAIDRLSGFLALLSVLLLAGCGASGDWVPEEDGAQKIRITGVVPDEGPKEGGVLVTVGGENFPVGEPSFVLVNTSYAPATILSDSLVKFVMPPCRDLGLVDVTVVTGSHAMRLAESFLVQGDPPAVTSISPPVGEAGTQFTLRLQEFPTCLFTTVTFDGVPAASVEVIDMQTMVAVMPAGLPLDEDVLVEVIEDDVTVQATVHHQAPLAVGDVGVNEFLADPRTVDANRDETVSTVGDEFVEIVNMRSTPINISGLRLRDASRERHRFPTGTTLPGGGAIVVFGFGNPQGFAGPHEDGQAQVASTGQLNLGNADTISIRAVDGATELFRVRFYSSDTARDISRNAMMDGEPVATPASGATDYELHDRVPGATLPLSPGRRIDGTSFR